MTFLDMFAEEFGESPHYLSAYEVLKRAEPERLLGISSTTDVMRQLNRIDPEMAMFVLGFIGSGDVPALFAKENRNGGITFPESPWPTMRADPSPPKTAVAGDIWVKTSAPTSPTYSVSYSTKPSSYVFDGTSWNAVPIKD